MSLRWFGPISVVMVLCCTTIWLYSDREWVEGVLAFDVQSASAEGEAEDAEEARKAMETAVDSGAFGVLLAARALWIFFRSHAVYWIVVLPLLGLYSGRWVGQRLFVSTVLETSPVLAAGMVLNALLRKWTVRLNATLSPAILLQGFDARIFWHQWALKLDVGLILFLILVAWRGARWFEEDRVTILLICSGVWASLTFASSLISSPFDLTF